MVKLASRAMGLIAVVVLLASCATSGDAPPKSSQGAASSATNPTQSAAATSTPTPKLLDFTAPKLGGGQVVGSELVGKDVAMFFWAPW